MNRASLLFLGIFFTLAFSFTSVVLTSQLSYGALRPHFDEGEGKSYPDTLSGGAAQGKLVYQDLGCVYCHTQQIRRAGFGADIERKWGERQSVARDYIRENRALIGDLRLGPDLRNVGARYSGDEGRAWHVRHLFDPQSVSPGSTMPSFRFLFETRQILGQPSARAVQTLLPEHFRPPTGYEIVPTARGESLIEYLLSLNDVYSFPEEAKRNYVEPKKEDSKTPVHKEEGHK